MTSLRVIVTGLIAQHRFLGGVTWDYLNVVLGLKKLGHDVYYVEDSGQWPYNLQGGPSKTDWIATDCTDTVEYLARVMSFFGLSDKWAYRFPIKPKWFGLSTTKRKELVATADLLINVSGTLQHPEHYREVPRLVYVDTDPVFTQIRSTFPRGQKKFCRRLNSHDVFFTVGERINESGPDTRHTWHPTKHPIALSEWSCSSSETRQVLTTIMNWTSYKPVTYKGRNFGQKDVEFMKFLSLPEKVRSVPLEIAIGKTAHVEWQHRDGDPLAGTDGLGKTSASWPLQLALSHYGWHVVDSAVVCPDFDTYRHYIQTSLGEWSVAKNGYVCTNSGWFSGRSACYLAAGKPVIVQNTGFDVVLPVGHGVLAFNTMDEATAAVEEVMGNYSRHAGAAREIAVEYFDSGKILPRMLDIALSSQVSSRAIQGQ